MPSITLTDIARMRVQAISFFLVCFLLSAWVVQGIWNSLRGDFPRLPRLSYRRSLGLVGLWGLLFLLVLTMISGARELMTPGAWRKEGYTYKLDEVKPAPVPLLTDADRRASIDRLRVALWTYARRESDTPGGDQQRRSRHGRALLGVVCRRYSRVFELASETDGLFERVR
jgi:hypothetical protein